MKKVIYIIYFEMAVFEYEKYGLPVWNNRNVKAEIWMLTDIFLGKRMPKVREPLVHPDVKKIMKYKELIQLLLKNRRQDTFCILILPPLMKQTYYVEMILGLTGYRYGVVYPQPYLVSFNKDFGKNGYSNRQKKIIPMVLNMFFPPTYNFIATKACYREFPSAYAIKKNKNCMIHTLDYDNYLKIKESTDKILEEKYILFIDENYVYHGDYQMVGIKSPFEVEKNYFCPLNNLFDRIEKLLDCKVVVAAHPRSDYKDGDIFGNRKIFINQTAQLIKDAELVICHTTSAMSYIMLFKKDFLLIYMNEIKKSFEWEDYYIPFINALKIQALNVSNQYCDQDIIKKISKYHYIKTKKYEEYFIKKRNTPEKPFFEVVADKILEL